MVKINTAPLESFAELTSNTLFIKKKITFKGRSTQDSFTIQPHNMICTCELRICETSDYLNNLQIRKQNDSREAFSFYEIVNCISIILGCTEALFSCLGKSLNKEYGTKKIFAKSNKKRKGDIAFFKFIRSASSVHPEKTNRHIGLTYSKHEFYPYVVWLNENYIDDQAPAGADIKLVYWNSNPNCFSKGYYFYSQEFFEFTDYVISLISKLNPIVQQIINNQKEKIRCKSLKSPTEFKSKSEYCLYLRSRLKKRKIERYEFPDGGLLIASHILSNELLDKSFKNFIYQRVKRIATKMCKDITEIGFDDTYAGLSLYSIIKDKKGIDGNYISEKFHSYLEREAKREIDKQEYIPFRTAFNNDVKISKYEDAKYITQRIFTQIPEFNTIEKVKNAYSYSDIYEIILELIWLKNASKSGKNSNDSVSLKII